MVKTTNEPVKIPEMMHNIWKYLGEGSPETCHEFHVVFAMVIAMVFGAYYIIPNYNNQPTKMTVQFLLKQWQITFLPLWEVQSYKGTLLLLELDH